ncbi:MAG: hypothetical protein Q8K58_05040 [Acidimicrobiales bacterium]|nr:hypothetical protein [Acidimicrobiales bacterium]
MQPISGDPSSVGHGEYLRRRDLEDGGGKLAVERLVEVGGFALGAVSGHACLPPASPAAQSLIPPRGLPRAQPGDTQRMGMDKDIEEQVQRDAEARPGDAPPDGDEEEAGDRADPVTGSTKPDPMIDETGLPPAGDDPMGGQAPSG